MQYPDTAQPPQAVPDLRDERQYVGWDGQRGRPRPSCAATTPNELREEEPDLLGVGVDPAVAIGQRALLVRTPGGNVLWDCVPVLDDAHGRAASERSAASPRSAISHPHFYAANVDIADAFDATRPASRTPTGQWIQRPVAAASSSSTNRSSPCPGVTVARIGGHFDGAAVLHWPAGSEGRGALLTGDTITVVQDRDWVSFMWSYPNLIPLDEAHRRRHRPPGGAVRLRPGLRRLVGPRGGAATAPRRSGAPPTATSPRLRGERP